MTKPLDRPKKTHYKIGVLHPRYCSKCERDKDPPFIRGICQSCYVSAWLRSRRLKITLEEALELPNSRKGYRDGCEIKGCENEHLARGLCSKHYHIWRRKNNE